MNNTNNRNLTLGGGLVAVLCFLSFSACGGPGSGNDSGMQILPDGGPMADAGDIPSPDAGMPPDSDAGMTPDGGVPDSDSGMACTGDMLLNRVSPPCDPDNDPAVGPGMAPTGLEGHVGPGHGWNSPTGSFGTGTAIDAMGRIGISMVCDESSSAPYYGVFYYSADGNWNANWANKDVPGEQGNHARIVFAADHRSATLLVFPGGSDVPSATVPLWET